MAPRIALSVLAALWLSAGLATPASAQPDAAGSTQIDEPNGFAPACAAPCFSVEKSFEVFLDGNPSAPGVCAVGENTYVYTLEHLGGTGPFVPALTKFEVDVENVGVNVTGAGFIPGPVDPSGVLIDAVADVVTWDFVAPPIASGQTSSQLFLCSPLPPGTVTDTAVSVDGQANLDAPGTCVGPVQPACDLEIDKKCCLPQPSLPDLGQCDEGLRSVLFEYTGDKCWKSNNDQGKAFRCFGRRSPGSPVDIDVIKDGGIISVTPDTGVAVGDTVEFTSSTGSLNDWTKIFIDGPYHRYQFLKLDTSCERAFACGDKFGALEVVGFEDETGEVVDCNAPPPPPSCQVPGSPDGTPCDAKLVDLVLEYVGQDCQDPLGNPQGGLAKCEGDSTGAVDVSVLNGGFPAFKTLIQPQSGINDGDRIRVSSRFKGSLVPWQKLIVTDHTGVLQTVKFGVDCSKPIELGDEFGPFRVVEFTEKTGDVVAFPKDLAQDACEIPLSPPRPHCTSDLQELTLVYIGDALGAGCTVNNAQSGFASCSGVDDPGDSVDVVLGSGFEGDPLLGLEFGDMVSITADGGGDLPSWLSLDATGPNGLQSIQLKTSCHKPLSLGDRFGSWVVFAMDREDDGAISLGGEILYQYDVTNPNPSTVDNVKITDDQLGDIVTGESLAAGETKRFTAPATLFATTTNVATVMGDIGGASCNVGSDSVTVDVLVPPLGAFSCACAQSLAEVTLIWDGTETVDVVAYDGDPTHPVLAVLDDVAPGDEVTVSGFTRDWSTWEIFDSTGAVKLGESVFHLTCRDRAMNGVEDCGKNVGDGKYDDPAKINSWLVEGLVDDDETLICSPEVDVPTNGECGMGPELALLLPALLWWQRRRMRRKA